METMLADTTQYSHLVERYLQQQTEMTRLARETMGNDDNLIRQEVEKQHQQQGVLVRKVLQEVSVIMRGVSEAFLRLK